MQSEAEAFWNNSGLAEVCSHYGEVKLGGSMMWGLMLDHRDIDLNIFTPNLERSKALDCWREIMDTKALDRCTFSDRVTRRKEGANQAYGFVILGKTDAQDVNWNLDIWIVNQEPQQNLELENLLKTEMTEDKRAIILELKYVRSKGLISDSVFSTTLYEAVMVWDVQNYEKFNAREKEFTKFSR